MDYIDKVKTIKEQLKKIGEKRNKCVGLAEHNNTFYYAISGRDDHGTFFDD